VTEIINTIVCPIVRRDYVLDALRSLRQWTPPNFKVVVVDQTQPDWEFSARLWELADVVVKPHLNYGFSGAVNLGIDMARTEYVTVMNDDVQFIGGHDWWAGIMATFERFDTAAAVNAQSPKEPGWGWAEPGYRYHVPKQWPDEELQRLGAHDRELQTAFRKVRLEAHALRTEDGDPDRLADLDDRLDELRAEMLATRAELEPLVYDAVMHAPGYVEMLTEDFNWAVVDGFPCWLPVFKREILVEEVGLFDERFSAGGEDYDATARAYQAGYRMLSSSQAWTWHWWGQSKDRADGLAHALPRARPPWNKIRQLWSPDLDVWGRDCERIDPEVKRFPL